MPRRIVHVIDNLDPANGGPQAVATRLAAAQASLGHQVTILCGDAPHAADRIARSIGSIPGFNRVSIRTVTPYNRAEHLLGRATRAATNDLIPHTDVFHLHGVWNAILLTVARCAKAADAPYVVMPHGMLDPWALGQKKLKKRIALALGYRAMLNHAAFIHALNDDEAAPIAALGVRAPVRVIPNGVFLDEIDTTAPRSAFATAHPALRDRPYLLFLSRLHYKKGLDYLADAFAIVAPRLPEVQLVVAGPDEGALPDFQERIRAASLQDRVHVVGPIYGPEKFAAITGAACFCLPSRAEGFSIAITESLACGTPVVITEQCHFPEVATARAGRVTPLDARAFADAIVDLLADEAARRAAGNAGRALVESAYTWPRVAERCESFYAEIRTHTRHST